MDEGSTQKLPRSKDVLDNSGIGNRELHLDLKSKAYLLGLNEMTISNQIRQGFFGQEVQRLIKGRDEIKIWLRYPLNDRNSISILRIPELRLQLVKNSP